MNEATFNTIKQKYSSVCSFAIWNKQEDKPKSNMNDTSVIFKNLSKLKTNFILVGLNISKKLDKPFSNFHCEKGNDYKIRYGIKGTIFEGAYMTDIIKDFEEKLSGKVMKYLRTNKDFEKKNVKLFEQELLDLQTTNPIIIAFGGDTYKILKRNLKYNIHKAYHYSAYVSNEKFRNKILEIEKNIKN